MQAQRDHLEALLRQAGGFWREGTALVATCPRCGKQKLHFRLELPRDRQIRNPYAFRFECFSGQCSAERFSGRPEYAIAEMLGISVGAARRELEGRSGSLWVGASAQLTDLEDESDIADSVTESPTLEWPGDFFPIASPQAERGAAYLAGRGVPIEIAQEYRVRYSVVDRAVVFPVETRGRLVGWQKRLVIDHRWTDPEGERRESPKAMTNKGFDRRHWMFGDRMLESPHAVVCEGPLDAVKLHLCGGNAASCGKKLTPGLLAALGEYPWRDLYCGLDAGTEEETERLVGEFDQAIKYPGRRCWLIEWPLVDCGCLVEQRLNCQKCGGKGKIQYDAGALSFEEAYECFRLARPVSVRSLFFDLRGG